MLGEVKEIKRLYKQGETPEPEELSGEYYVVVPWFPWLSLKPLKHRKSVAAGGEGDNVLLKDIHFGKFRLEKDGQALLINYDTKENPLVIRGVKDRIRRLPDGRLIGKLDYNIAGMEIFIMYFEMVPRESR